MSTFALTAAETFTLSHAKLIGSKVATDLLRFQHFYGRPSDETINSYEAELIALLRHDYLDTVTYGFKRNGLWVEAIKYRALLGGVLVADDDPGKIRPVADVTDAGFTSYLTHNQRWWNLGATERTAFETTLPFQRGSGQEPGIEGGYWADDRNYTAGGRGVARSTVRRF